MMDLSSGSKRSNVPMGAPYAESIHEPTSSSKQLFTTGVSKGSVSSGAAANDSANAHNLNRMGSLGQANLFSPANHSQLNPSAGQAVTDNSGSLKRSTSGKDTLSNSNITEDKDINVMSSSNSNLNRTSRVELRHSDSHYHEDGSNKGGGVRYRECMKNHAANMGGYALDGCGEFMPSGEEGSLEALKCAACGCHRNFHRREMNGGNQLPGTSISLLALPSPLNASNTSASNTSDYGDGDHIAHGINGTNVMGSDPSGGAAPAGIIGPAHYSAGHMGALLPHLHHHHHHHQYMNAWMAGTKALQVQGAGAAQQIHTAAGRHAHHAAAGAGAHHAAAAGVSPGPYPAYLGMGPGGHLLSGGSVGSAGKRFRTKFTMEQREKMYEFSEKVGWRIQKQDEAAVQQFCAEAGVKRHVLKVWMHNNKNTFGKKLLRFPEAFNALPESSS